MSRIRLTRLASITGELDRIAEGLESDYPVVALAIDLVSDGLERRVGYGAHPEPEDFARTPQERERMLERKRRRGPGVGPRRKEYEIVGPGGKFPAGPSR